jgi:hypothetical protein
VVGVLDEAAQLRDLGRVLFGERELVWFASLASAEPGAFGVRHGQVEVDVFGARQAGSAGRAAVHTGCPDRVHKRAIGFPVMRDDRRPARIGCRRCGVHFAFAGHVHFGHPFNSSVFNG